MSAPQSQPSADGEAGTSITVFILVDMCEDYEALGEDVSRT